MQRTGERPNLDDVLAEAAAVAPRLPDWAGFAGAIATLLGAYAVVLAIVISLADAENVLTFFAAGLLVAAATTGFALFRRRTALDGDTVSIPVTLRTTLAAYGLREVEVLAGSSGDGAWGWLRSVTITLSDPTVADRAGLRFVLWHEVAHAVRRDDARRWVADTLGYAVFLASVFTADVPAAVAGALGALLLRTAHRWLAEVACDRIAVAHAGPDSFLAWAGRAHVGLAVRFRDLLSHPPLGWRQAAAVRPLPRRSRSGA